MERWRAMPCPAAHEPTREGKGHMPVEGRGGLLKRVGLSMFWNAAMLPLIAVFQLASSLLIRRYFGLDSGLYDVLIGLANTLVFLASVGVPDALTLFVPQLESAGSRAGVAAFLRRSSVVSLGALALLFVPIALLSTRIGEWFGLDGSEAFVYLAFVLAIVRTLNNLQVKSLQGLLEHRAANLVQLLLAVVTALGLLATALGGMRMVAVMIVLIATTALVLVPGGAWVRRTVAAIPEDEPPPDSRGPEFSPGVSAGGFWRFCLFMYGHNWLNYFVRPAFASPTIMAATGSRAMVATFNVGYNLPFTAVTLMVSSFQGLYRPMFSRLIDQPEKLRTGFREVTKVQIALLLPAGAGLAVMAGDYIRLLFGSEFSAAAPITQVLCGLLFIETTLNLGTIILSIDHRYRAVYSAMMVRLLAMPVFVYFASRGALVGAAIAFGGGRLLSVLVGFWLCRRAFGVRYPVAFLARTALPTAVMAGSILLLRPVVGGSWPAVLGLTAFGISILVLATRWSHVLSERETDLLRRSGVPGAELIVRAIAPRARDRSDQ